MLFPVALMIRAMVWPSARVSGGVRVSSAVARTFRRGGAMAFSFYFACPFWKFRWSNCNYPIVFLVGYLVVVVAVVGACMKLEKFLSGARL